VLVLDAYANIWWALVTTMAETVTNTLKLSPAYFVSNI